MHFNINLIFFRAVCNRLDNMCLCPLKETCQKSNSKITQKANHFAHLSL